MSSVAHAFAANDRLSDVIPTIASEVSILCISRSCVTVAMTLFANDVAAYCSISATATARAAQRGMHTPMLHSRRKAGRNTSLL